MKKLFMLATGCLLFSACLNESKEQSNQKNAEDMEQISDKSKIEKLLFSYRDALNSSDVKTVLLLYTADGVFMPSGAPSAVGQEQVKSSYEFVFSQIQLNIEFFIDEVVINGNHAFARTRSKGTTLVHATGARVPEENRELFVLLKEEGQWKISRYMFNKMK